MTIFLGLQSPNEFRERSAPLWRPRRGEEDGEEHEGILTRWQKGEKKNKRESHSTLPEKRVPTLNLRRRQGGKRRGASRVYPSSKKGEGRRGSRILQLHGNHVISQAPT